MSQLTAPRSLVVVGHHENVIHVLGRRLVIYRRNKAWRSTNGAGDFILFAGAFT